MGELDHKEGWAPKYWCFWTVVLEKTLESPLDCKEIKPSILKEIIPEYSLEALMLKFQYFAHLMQRANSLKKTLLLGKIEGKRSGQQMIRWWDSITDSLDMNSSKLQEIVEDRGAWHALIHGITNSQIWLSRWATTTLQGSVEITCDDFYMLQHDCKTGDTTRLYNLFIVGKTEVSGLGSNLMKGT